MKHRKAPHNPELPDPKCHSEKPWCRWVQTTSIYTQEIRWLDAFLAHMQMSHKEEAEFVLKTYKWLICLCWLDWAAPGHSAVNVPPFPQAPDGMLPGPAWHWCWEETCEYWMWLRAIVLMSLWGFSPFDWLVFPKQHQQICTLYCHSHSWHLPDQNILLCLRHCWAESPVHSDFLHVLLKTQWAICHW